MSETAVTERGRSRGVYLVVVHDVDVDVAALCETLRDAFVVREVTSAFDTLERLSGAPLACVVCVIGKTIVGEDFFALVKRAAPELVQRVLFVASQPLCDRERAFLKANDGHLVPEGSSPEEVLAIVNAVSGKR